MKNANSVAAVPVERVPAVGQSVFIGFNTNGAGKIVKKGALDIFDKIAAVYSDRETTKAGKNLFRVQLRSGDLVVVEPGSKSADWQAVA